MTLTIAKWTLDDYHRLIETGLLNNRRVELLRGLIVEMAPEGRPHTYFSDWLAKRLQRQLEGRAQVREAKPITLPDDSEPEPDIAVVAPLDRVYLEHHPYPENIFWLIEYADSSLRKDMEDKSAIYAEAGIQEYWVVDLRNQTLVVFQAPQNGKYQQQKTLADGTITPIAFPDVQVPVLSLMQ